MLLELCNCGTLKQFTDLSEGKARRKQLSEEEIQRIAYEMLRALKYLKQNRVLHRDLKPENVFLKHESVADLATVTIKLGDFGLAIQLQHDDERRRTVCGTPNYFPPELVVYKALHYTK